MRRLILEHGLHRNELEHETQAVTNELEVLRARFVMETEGLRSQVFLQARDLERLGGRVKTLLHALENCEKRINELETDKMNLEKEIADKDMNLYVGLGRYGGRFRGRRRRVSILLI
jgi:chromosome segregation ATPase